MDIQAGGSYIHTNLSIELTKKAHFLTSNWSDLLSFAQKQSKDQEEIQPQSKKPRLESTSQDSTSTLFTWFDNIQDKKYIRNKEPLVSNHFQIFLFVYLLINTSTLYL